MKVIAFRLCRKKKNNNKGLNFHSRNNVSS
jgi:hypothetical protein